MFTRFFFLCVFFTAILTLSPFLAFADIAQDITARKTQLQVQLDSLNAQIVEQQRILEQKQGQSTSLERDVEILAAQIEKDTLSIKARDINIQTLTSDIGQKNQTITSLDDKLVREEQSLAQILRQTKALDASTLAEFILSADSLSSFFHDLDSFASIQSALAQSFTDIGNTKIATVSAKVDLEDQRSKEKELRQQQVIQEKQVEANKKQQETLLAYTKAQTSQYQSAIISNRRVISQIEAELFSLRDTVAIPFSQALSYASFAFQKTGVRPAFILGVLKQESDLGENIGACYVTSLESGDGIGKNSGTVFQKIMKAPRDTTPFQEITSALGIPWATAPVSCPTSPLYTTSRGYGGAIGPSQFIPSTWELYIPRLAQVLTVQEPDPWNPKDAIMATALYLSDIGAVEGGGYTGERNAACKYYSGRSCDSRTPANQFYADAVMDNAGFFQNQIDLINGGI